MGDSIRLTLRCWQGLVPSWRLEGRIHFVAHAWCWQSSVSFFFYLDCDIIDIQQCLSFSVLTRYTYVFQCDDHHSLELTPPYHHIITIYFLW